MINEFPVIIPWRSEKHLGECMNDAMENIKDWVLFMDHDVLQINPNWYLMCLEIIKKTGHEAGWISCLTNAIGCRWQRYKENNMIFDLNYHIDIAKKQYKEFGTEIFEPDNYGPFSGFFILTHKKAWLDVGGFNNGWMVDNPYDIALREKGYKRYIMKGLYCYHMYTSKGIFNV